MTLKSSLRTATDEDGYIVQNHNINENFGETTADFLDLGGQNLNPKQVKRFHQSCSLLERRTKEISDLNENMCGLGYTSQNQSSLKGGGDEDVSFLENLKANAKDESEDSTSELSETSPLLGDFDEVSSTDEEEDKDLYSPSSNEIEDCNNNNRETASEGSEYSMFSDSSEMSDCREEEDFVMENNYNNNNNNNPPNDPIVRTNFRHHLHIDDEAKQAFSAKTLALLRDGGDTQTKLTKDFLTTFDAIDEFVPSPTNEIPSDFEQGELKQVPSNSQKRVNQIRDIHSKCIAKVDVNLVSSSFNNFTLSAGKRNDILSLVETEDNQRQANIQKTESKILNTKQLNLPRNMTEEYQYHLQNKVCPKNGGVHLKQLADSPQDRFSDAKERSSPCIRCSQQNAIEDDSNDSVTNIDRASVVTNSECTCSLSTETSKFSSVAYEKNIQTLISPSRRDSLKSIDVIESDCVQNEFRTDPQLISDKDFGVERSDWLSAENNAGSIDVESPTDNLIPAIPISLDLLGGPDQLNPSTCGRDSALDKTVHDSFSTTVKSETTNCNENSVAHVKCKSVSPARELFGDFDVYNIETTMPTIDWAAMEAHLSRAAKEEDWLLRRHNDREEIRKKLAMDSDSEEYYCGEKVTKKPSLSTRLQSGMNLQICFMNEAASDQESQGSDQDSENGPTDENIRLNNAPTVNEITSEFQQEKPVLENFLENSRSISAATILTDNSKENNTDQKNNASIRQYPTFFFARKRNWHLQLSKTDHHEQNLNEHKKASVPEENFYTCHARLQAEARMALAQAKEMARMQMEVERQKSKKSPIADIVGLPFPDNCSHINRQILADMNVAQLQVIVNDLHTQIENLNEELVQLLLNRDDLHMEQDSMLVDIEDLTRYLGAKDEALQNLQTNEEKISLPKLAQMLKKVKEK